MIFIADEASKADVYRFAIPACGEMDEKRRVLNTEF